MGNIQKLYYRSHKPTLVAGIVDGEVKGNSEPKRARLQAPLLNSVDGTSSCLPTHTQSPSDAPSDAPSVSSRSSSSDCRPTDVPFSCTRYKCHVCATVVLTKSAMMGHFFVFHPSVSFSMSLIKQKMIVLLTKLKMTEIEVTRDLCMDPIVNTAVNGHEPLDSGWLIEHIPEIKVAGELVWAKLTGFPWWPGVILDNAESKCHFRTSQIRSSPSAETEYNVLFFDKQSMQRAWISESNLEAYQPDNQKSLTKQQSNKYKARFSEALAWAAEVYDWSSSDRRRFFDASFKGKT